MSTESGVGKGLRVRHDDGQTEELFVQHGLTIGANASNSIQVTGRGVERIHARICRADGGYVVSCESNEAMLVMANGELVRSLALAPGGVFRIGGL